LIAAVTKDPVSETIRVCWDAGLSECDVLIPLWDAWAQEANARATVPDWYQIEVDPENHFHSGGPGVAPGFGPFYKSGDVNSTNRFHDIPAGTLSAGSYYYIRLRVGETNDWMKSGSDALASNGGWGTWSVGFYRFVVGAGTLEPPENLRLVE
jgi:hypothetical protein